MRAAVVIVNAEATTFDRIADAVLRTRDRGDAAASSGVAIGVA